MITVPAAGFSLLSSLVSPAALQHPVPVSGIVVHVVGKDTVPAPRAHVLVHRVAKDAQGPVDSFVAGVEGRFALTVRADSGAVYLLSARWGGIEYFAPPLATRPGDLNGNVRILASDTSSNAPAGIAARHLVVAVGETGTRQVLDLFVIGNHGTQTRVSRDTLHPSLRILLPPNAVNFSTGESDFSQDAIAVHGDTLLLFAPIPPGERDLRLSYEIPPNTRRFAIPNDAAVPIANVLTDDDAITVESPMVRSDSQIVQDARRFTRWTGTIAAGQSIILVVPGITPPPDWLLPVMVAVFGVVLAVLSLVALRRRPASLAHRNPAPYLDRHN